LILFLSSLFALLVLINYLKDQKNEAVKQFEYILDKKLPYGINTFIYQEIALSAEFYCMLYTIPKGEGRYGKTLCSLWEQSEYRCDA